MNVNVKGAKTGRTKQPKPAVFASRGNYAKVGQDLALCYKCKTSLVVDGKRSNEVKYQCYECMQSPVENRSRIMDGAARAKIIGEGKLIHVKSGDKSIEFENPANTKILILESKPRGEEDNKIGVDDGESS